MRGPRLTRTRKILFAGACILGAGSLFAIDLLGLPPSGTSSGWEGMLPLLGGAIGCAGFCTYLEAREAKARWGVTAVSGGGFVPGFSIPLYATVLLIPVTLGNSWSHYLLSWGVIAVISACLVFAVDWIFSGEAPSKKRLLVRGETKLGRGVIERVRLRGDRNG